MPPEKSRPEPVPISFTEDDKKNEAHDALSENNDFVEFELPEFEETVSDVDKINNPEPDKTKIDLEYKKSKYTATMKSHCVNVGFSGALSGGILGGIVGLYQGFTDPPPTDLIRRTPLALRVAKVGALPALTFGVLLGSCQATTCALQAFRGKKDFLNSFGGGFVGGFLSALPTRSLTSITVSAFGTGILFAAIDSLPFTK